MIVIFRGRRKDGHHLNDMWGLRRYRSCVWVWMKAPFKGTPRDRIQHSSVFCGKFFINTPPRNREGCANDLGRKVTFNS